MHHSATFKIDTTAEYTNFGSIASITTRSIRYIALSPLIHFQPHCSNSAIAVSIVDTKRLHPEYFTVLCYWRITVAPEHSTI